MFEIGSKVKFGLLLNDERAYELRVEALHAETAQVSVTVLDGPNKDAKTIIRASNLVKAD